MKPDLTAIVADDLGYAHLGCHGGRSASSGPVLQYIDVLTDGGLKFTDGYLLNIANDTHERADRQAWQATVQAIPEDAGVSLGYSHVYIPQR